MLNFTDMPTTPQDLQPLVKEKQSRLSTQSAFLVRFNKYTIEEKQQVITELTQLLNAEKQKTINEAQALIDKLSGGKKLGTSEKPIEKIPNDY
jgi:hypothetical protein